MNVTVKEIIVKITHSKPDTATVNLFTSFSSIIIRWNCDSCRQKRLNSLNDVLCCALTGSAFHNVAVDGINE